MMLAELQAPAKPRWALRDVTLAQVEAMFIVLMSLDDEEDDDPLRVSAPSERDAD